MWLLNGQLAIYDIIDLVSGTAWSRLLWTVKESPIEEDCSSDTEVVWSCDSHSAGGSGRQRRQGRQKAEGG